MIGTLLRGPTDILLDPSGPVRTGIVHNNLAVSLIIDIECDGRVWFLAKTKEKHPLRVAVPFFHSTSTVTLITLSINMYMEYAPRERGKRNDDMPDQ